jgi:hypothetical protein
VTKFTQRITQITVAAEFATVISETATRITIEDHAAGELVSVDQAVAGGRILISPEEWPTLRDAIDKMVAACIPEGK